MPLGDRSVKSAGGRDEISNEQLIEMAKAAKAKNDAAREAQE